MHAVTAGVIAAVIVAMLLFVDPMTTAFVGLAVAGTYALISFFTRSRLAANSDALETAFDDRMKVMQESLGGIRDVIVDNSQGMYLREFETVDLRLASARAANQFIAAAPRYLIEMVGMIVIAVIALVAARGPNGIAAALPILGALALGAQRLLPLVQDVYSGWSTLEGQRSIFGQVIDLLRLPVSESGEIAGDPLELRDSVRLENIGFTYASRREAAVSDVNLTIARGSMLALVGPTGSGKSTLVDVIMGLLQADSGRILLDGVALENWSRRQWHRSIAHVPQSIFLTDSTFARNIALSLPDHRPDHDRIVESAKRAQLHDFIEALPERYETRVGERGIRLSGGQRQRLGIARAIYKDAPILILDEATSALDDVTEAAVISTLEELRREGRTIIIVAHRLSTIRHCDTVARLLDGRLVEFGPKLRVRDDAGLSIGS
jgi:ATP-binding cassette subfamily B protein